MPTTSNAGELHGNEIVIRGGLMDDGPMLTSLANSLAEDGLPLLSVSADLVRDGELELAAIERIVKTDKVPHGQLCLTEVGALWEAGFTLWRAPPPPYHVNIDAVSADLEVVERLRSVFRRTLENPVDREERRQWRSS